MLMAVCDSQRKLARAQKQRKKPFQSQRDKRVEERRPTRVAVSHGFNLFEVMQRAEEPINTATYNSLRVRDLQNMRMSLTFFQAYIRKKLDMECYPTFAKVPTAVRESIAISVSPPTHPKHSLLTYFNRFRKFILFLTNLQDIGLSIQ